MPLPAPIPTVGENTAPNLRMTERRELSNMTQESAKEQTLGQGVDTIHTDNGTLPQFVNPGVLLPMLTARQGRIVAKTAWRNQLDTYQVLEQQLARREGCSQMDRRQQDIARNQYVSNIL